VVLSRDFLVFVGEDVAEYGKRGIDGAVVDAAVQAARIARLPAGSM